jgi:hypothetical protein
MKLRRVEMLIFGRRLKTTGGYARVLIPRPGVFPSFYVFALHKSGSTLMNNMLGKAFDQVKIPHLALSELAFAAGLPEGGITNPEKFIFSHGYCYRGFRAFPHYLKAFDILKNKKILLLRDPRDILVSMFFSVACSHNLPTKGIVREQMIERRGFANSVGVDEYCLSQVPFCKTAFNGYRHLADTNIRIYRYEDVIFEKRKWLADMLSYFEVDLPQAIVDRIAKAHDVWPARENPLEHIRQVTPGNFRKHLQQRTIEILNHEFAPELAHHSYLCKS